MAHEELDVVSDPVYSGCYSRRLRIGILLHGSPAINCVRASAVNSSRPRGFPFSSLPCCSLLRRSSWSAPNPLSSREDTAAIAIPASFLTAASPRLNQGNFFAMGLKGDAVSLCQSNFSELQHTASTAA